MKRFFATFTLIVLGCLTAFAQWGTDKISIRYPVRHMPAQYVPESNRSYYVELGLSRMIQPFVDYNEVCDNLVMEDWGWSMKDKAGDAALLIHISARDFLIEGIHEEEHTEMVRIHGEMVPRKYYTPHIDYTIVMGWFFKLQGRPIYDYTNVNPDTHRPPLGTFRMDKRFSNPHDCHEFVRNNNELFLEQIIMAEISAFYGPIHAEFERQFYYTPSTDNIKLAFFDSKKNPYYQDQQHAARQIRSILENFPIDGDMSKLIKDMQPWIEYFKSLEEEMNINDKKQRDAKMDQVFNLANIYYSLEIFDVARQYCHELMDKYDNNYGKRMLKWIDNVEQGLEKHHQQSRHF